MSEQARRVSIAGMMRRSPGMSEEEASSLLVRRLLGEPLYEAAYGRDPE